MKLDLPVLKTAFSAKDVDTINPRNSTGAQKSSNTTTLPTSDDLRPCSESFRKIETGAPWADTAENKLSWLRSQLIGADETFTSPFGQRRITYADHTASGRSLLYIERFILNNVLPFYGNSHTCDSYVGHRTTKMVHEATQYVKMQLGGKNHDALLFCGSGTTAALKRLQEVMGIAVPSTLRETLLKSTVRSEERWVVFVGPYEHHSNLLSWRQTLAEVVEVCLDDNGLLDLEALRLKLELYQKANRPMLGSFSACSNVTGVCTDTKALARLLHQFGAFACFDFAASGPYVEIDMRSGEMDGYDAIFLSPHKFLGGPGSSGILLMSNALYQLGSSAPSTCGGGTVNFVNGFSEKDTLYLEGIEERENAGTPPIIQTIKTALTFWVKEYIGNEAIQTLERKYIEKALKRLLPNQNLLVLGNTSAERQAILSFLIYSTIHSSSNDTETNYNTESRRDREELYPRIETGNKRDKPLPGPFVAKLLNDLFGIQARGGCACAGPYGHRLLNVDEPQSLAFRSAIQKGYAGVKPGWTRVSFPYYMTEEELEFILAAIEFVCIYGQRFLPLYHFNWKSGTWRIKMAALKETLLGKNSSCNISCDLPLVHGLQAENSDSREFGIVQEFTTYLEAAKYIANLLPKFPPQRKVPEDLEPDLLHFRV